MLTGKKRVRKRAQKYLYKLDSLIGTVQEDLSEGSLKNYLLEQYNYALYLGQIEEYGHAIDLLSTNKYMELSHKDKLRLKIIELLFLLYILNNEKKKARLILNEEFNESLFIKYQPLLIDMKVKSSSNIYIKWLAYASLSVFIVGIFLFIDLKRQYSDENINLNVEVETMKNSINQYKEDIESLKGQLNEEKDKSNHEKNKLEVNQSYSEDDLKKLFTEGYSLYKARQYNEAIKLFNKIINNDKIYYFTDDAHYYLIKSLLNTKQNQVAYENIVSFFEENNNNYLKSTYVQAVKLEKVKYILNFDHSHEADIEKLLMDIINNAEKWVADEAKIVLKKYKNS